MPRCGAMDTASPSSFPPRRALVAFATEHGSTGEIARTIGAGLSEAGLEVGRVAYGTSRADRRLPSRGRGQRCVHEPLAEAGNGLPEEIPDAEGSVEAGGERVVGPEASKCLDRLGARGHVTFPGRIGDDMTGPLERWMPRGDWGGAPSRPGREIR